MSRARLPKRRGFPPENASAGSVKDPASHSEDGALFGSPADRDGPVALRPRIASGLPLSGGSLYRTIASIREGIVTVNPPGRRMSRMPRQSFLDRALSEPLPSIHRAFTERECFRELPSHRQSRR